MAETQKNSEKPNFGPDLGPLDPNSAQDTFFSKIWLRQSLDIMVAMYNIKKTNDPILRKRSDGRTDEQTDGQTDRRTKSDFIGLCLTNIERPIEKKELFCKKAPY